MPAEDGKDRRGTADETVARELSQPGVSWTKLAFRKRRG